MSYQNVTSTLDRILARGHLRVGTTGEYKPFSYLIFDAGAPPTPDGMSAVDTHAFIGADIIAAKSLSNALGLAGPPRFVLTDWESLTSDLAADKFDIAMGGISITLPRARSAFFSTPVLMAGKMACIRCADQARFTSLATIDQAGVRVVVNEGGSNHAFDETHLKQADLLSLGDNNVVYQLVRNGSADVMISDSVEVELHVKLYPGELCAVADGPWNFEELGYMMGRDSVWKEFVDQWLRVWIGSGKWREILTTWMEFSWPSG